MSRPAVVYLVMIVVLIAGLWAVLHIGNNYLSAPEDLAGKWQLQAVTNSTANSGANSSLNSTLPEMNVEQSGKFFQVAFDHFDQKLQLDLKLQSNSPTVLSNSKWKLIITGRDGSDDKTVQLQGPQTARWAAHRTVRTFPSDITTATTREAK